MLLYLLLINDTMNMNAIFLSIDASNFTHIEGKFAILQIKNNNKKIINENNDLF